MTLLRDLLLNRQGLGVSQIQATRRTRLVEARAPLCLEFANYRISATAVQEEMRQNRVNYELVIFVFVRVSSDLELNLER